MKKLKQNDNTGLRCSECKHINSISVNNGWSKTRCRLEPDKEFYEIEKDNSCGFQPCNFSGKWIVEKRCSCKS